MNPLTLITRNLNKTFKDALAGLRVQASAPGSFLAIRIDDPEGKVSVRLADAIARAAAAMFIELGAIDSPVPLSCGWHMNGVVANWARRH